jgi:predicted transposase YbfD/YdcC
LADIIMIALWAVACGQRSIQAIYDWANAHTELLAERDLKCPSMETIRRVLALIDGDTFDALFGSWALQATRSSTSGVIAVAIDGKEVRGAKTNGCDRVHLLGAATHTGAVIGQVSVDAKTNEIPCLEGLLDQIGDIDGVVVTLDALHTQVASAALIADRGAWWVFQLKGNQPTVLDQVKHLPWEEASVHRQPDLHHGLLTHRHHRILRFPDGEICFPGARQAIKLRRTRIRIDGTKTWEEVFIITNHPTATAQQLARWIRGHWRIESIHWLRDNHWSEDASLIRTRNLPRIMATIRNTIISFLHLRGITDIARNLRINAAKPQATANLIGL